MLNILKQRLLLIFIAMLTFLPISSYPLDIATAQNTQVEAAVVDSKQLDKRALILKDYLARYDSPLQNHAQDFVDAADKYNLDWKLVAAISGVESTFGKQIPGGYNAWGWAIYNSDSRYGFKSWTDGIYEVSRGLKIGYVDKGLKDPLAMNRIYAASPVWGFKVNYFLNDLEIFSKRYENKNPQSVKTILSKTAVPSAQLAFNIN